MPAALKHLANTEQLSGAISSLLAHWKDGLFYAIRVLECDLKKRKCRVKFEDDHECWMDHKDLHIQFTIDTLKDEHIVCCMCDDGVSQPPNEIIMCDVCQQGFHIQCHQPPVDRDQAKLEDEEVEWACQTCSQLVNSPPPSQTSDSVKTPTKSAKSNSNTPPKSKSARKVSTVRPKLDRKISKSARKAPCLKVRLSKRSETKINESTQNLIKEPEAEKKPDVIEPSSGSVDDEVPAKTEELKVKPEKAGTTDSNPETPVTYIVQPNPSSKDDAIVEEMDPVVILAAQKLAEAEDISKTSEFVDEITNDNRQIQDRSPAPLLTKTKAQTKSHGSSRRKAMTTAIPKTVTTAAAAAY